MTIFKHTLEPCIRVHFSLYYQQVSLFCKPFTTVAKWKFIRLSNRITVHLPIWYQVGGDWLFKSEKLFCMLLSPASVRFYPPVFIDLQCLIQNSSLRILLSPLIHINLSWNSHLLRPWYKKCGSWTSRICDIWKLVWVPDPGCSSLGSSICAL